MREHELKVNTRKKRRSTQTRHRHTMTGACVGTAPPPDPRDGRVSPSADATIDPESPVSLLALLLTPSSPPTDAESALSTVSLPTPDLPPGRSLSISSLRFWLVLLTMMLWSGRLRLRPRPPSGS